MKLNYHLTVHRLVYKNTWGDETGTCGWVDVIIDGEVRHTEEFHGKVGCMEVRSDRPYTRVVAVDVGTGGDRMEVTTRCAPGCIFEVDVALEAEKQ